MSNEDTAATNAAGDTAGDSAHKQQQPVHSTPAAMLLYCSYLAESSDPRLKSLLLWADPRLSGAALATALALLWAVATRSFISVLAYLGLAALMCACALRLYRFVRLRRQHQQQAASAAVNDEEASDEPLPLRWLLQAPVRLPRERLLNFLDRRLASLERAANYFLCLMLCRDPVRTLKLFCCLIGLTYIGAWINATTLAGLAVLSAFSLPKLYSMRHAQVDAALARLLDRYHLVNARIRATIPFGKEKAN